MKEELARLMAGEHRMLYAPDSISKASLELLKEEPMVREIINLNNRSSLVIHGIGDALQMAERDIETGERQGSW